MSLTDPPPKTRKGSREAAFDDLCILADVSNG